MRRRRRFWIALTVLPVLLLAGDAVYWRFVAQQLDAGFRAWITAQRGEGRIIQAGPPTLGGWPFAATLTSPGVQLTDFLEFPGGLTWRAEHLVLRVALLHPEHLEASPGGPQYLRFGTGPAIPFTADRIVADVPLPHDEPPHAVTVQASNLRARVASGGTVRIQGLTATFDLQQASARDKPVLAFGIGAHTLALPSHLHWALGPTIGSLRADGVLTAPFPQGFTRLARAVAWRDQGGELEVRHLDLHWGPLDMSTSGRLGLDRQLQPIGHATARVTGYNDTLDAMTQAGVMPPSAALAARALLSLMAKPAAQGHPAEVDVPLRLQHNTLFMQTVPLARLPELDWSAP